MFASRSLRTLLFAALFCNSYGLGAVPQAHAEAPEPTTLEKIGWVFDNDYYKVNLDMRMRIGLANSDTLSRSEAPTLRTRLGLGTKPFRGFSAYAELENVVSMCDSCYFDAVESPTGQTPIADVEVTQLNRAFLKYENEGGAAPFTASVGRQRIIYDDARWVGNVGWRQNEQTFDSASASTSLGIEGLEARYGYLWEIKRIFGDEDDANPAQGDFDSNSHIMSLGYQIPSGPKVLAFTYLLDLENDAPGSVSNSSNSFGFRVNGAWAFAEDWKLDYVGSYAYQGDAKDNPVNYDAHYVWVSTTLGFAPLGGLGIGFEMLGSDDGLARVVTPLSTAHKFNGFADVFLDNGGVTGLQDMFITLAPKLPWGLKMKLIYHRFWNDDSGDTLGNEIDGILSKKLPYGFTVLSKGAYFNSTADGRAQGRQTIWRWTFDVSYQF